MSPHGACGGGGGDGGGRGLGEGGGGGGEQPRCSLAQHHAALRPGHTPCVLQSKSGGGGEGGRDGRGEGGGGAGGGGGDGGGGIRKSALLEPSAFAVITPVHAGSSIRMAPPNWS